VTFIAFIAWTLTMIGVGFALALLLGWHIDTRRRRQDAADPLAEYETVAAPEHAPSRN
jgi:hypothetical protein